VVLKLSGTSLRNRTGGVSCQFPDYKRGSGGITPGGVRGGAPEAKRYM
jgi:hypothetical protein